MICGIILQVLLSPTRWGIAGSQGGKGSAGERPTLPVAGSLTVDAKKVIVGGCHCLAHIWK